MQDEVLHEIETAIETGSPLVVATVAASRGSTPRKPGAKMVVREDGTFTGTIGGGCGEAEVWQEAMNVLENGRPKLVVVDLTESPEGEDKICGGIMEVFVERVV
jgi:xanthine dehydrogenase accessory factor